MTPPGSWEAILDEISLKSLSQTVGGLRRRLVQETGNGSDTGLTSGLHGTEVSMLVLSRKPSQRIVIGKDVVITVVRIDRNQVRIGVEAPKGIAILRDELTSNQPREVEDSEEVLAEALWSVG